MISKAAETEVANLANKSKKSGCIFNTKFFFFFSYIFINLVMDTFKKKVILFNVIVTSGTFFETPLFTIK